MKHTPLPLLAYLALASIPACAQSNPADDLARANAAIQSQPQNPSAYHARGVAYFFLNRMDESVADFDREVELDPAREPHHWQRGIAQFFAGQFIQCQKQFEAHRTVNGADMENSLWHFACIARQQGFEAAQGVWDHPWTDGRPTMAELWRLYQGKGTADAVTQAIAESPRQQDACFYGNFYLGMYWDLRDEPKLARQHMDQAAKACPIPHYMGEVARVYALRLATTPRAADAH